jgi:hypothetical protein
MKYSRVLYQASGDEEGGEEASGNEEGGERREGEPHTGFFLDLPFFGIKDLRVLYQASGDEVPLADKIVYQVGVPYGVCLVLGRVREREEGRSEEREKGGGREGEGRGKGGRTEGKEGRTEEKGGRRKKMNYYRQTLPSHGSQYFVHILVHFGFRFNEFHVEPVVTVALGFPPFFEEDSFLM